MRSELDRSILVCIAFIYLNFGRKVSYGIIVTHLSLPVLRVLLCMLKFLINLIKYQMNTKTHYGRLSRGFKKYLDPQSLINTQQNFTAVTNNWFNDIPLPNHLLPYGTIVFSSDEERRNCFLIWCLGDHNHALVFNLLGFSLSPNGPNWFSLIKPISFFCWQSNGFIELDHFILNSSKCKYLI